MPVSPLLKAPFQALQFYHIVCKSIDGLLLFPDEQDYFVFHQRFQRFTQSYFDVWSYTLLENHGHYIIKVKSTENIIDAVKKMKPKHLTESQCRLAQNTTDELIMNRMLERQMNRFLVSYCNYYKNKYFHHGGLFQKPFKRIKIQDADHLQQAIIYTHANSQKHDIIKDYKLYPYSSFLPICNSHQNGVFKEVVDFFGGVDLFVKLHDQQINYYYSSYWRYYGF